MNRQVQSNQVKSAVLSNQLIAKNVTSQLILSGSKQVLTPIISKSITNNLFFTKINKYVVEDDLRFIIY